MQVYETPWIRLASGCLWAYRDWQLCKDELAEWFDVPESATRIKAVVHVSPSPTRYEIILTHQCGCGRAVEGAFLSPLFEITDTCTDRWAAALRKNPNLRLYVEVWYRE